jgi:hypothetical protein
MENEYKILKGKYTSLLKKNENLMECIKHLKWEIKELTHLDGATDDDDDDGDDDNDDDCRTSLHEESNAIIHSKGTSQAYWDAIRPGIRTTSA